MNIDIIIINDIIKEWRKAKFVNNVKRDFIEVKCLLMHLKKEFIAVGNANINQ